MRYTVIYNRYGAERVEKFTDYPSALELYKSECAEELGPVFLSRWDDEGNIDIVLQHTPDGEPK